MSLHPEDVTDCPGCNRSRRPRMVACVWCWRSMRLHHRQAIRAALWRDYSTALADAFQDLAARWPRCPCRATRRPKGNADEMSCGTCGGAVPQRAPS